MHIVIEKTELQRNIDLVAKISTKHQTLPVLQCVLIEAEDKKLTLKTTNLELGIEAVCKGEIKEKGVVAVQAHTLSQTIGLLNDEKISLKTEENALSIQTKHSKTKIKTLPHEEFPTIPKLETETQTVNNTLFAVGIKTALFAVSLSSIKPELGSVYINQYKPHTLTFVSTDSFRLVEKTVSQKSFTLQEPILIPHRNAQEIARIFEQVGTDPEFLVSENQCAFVFTTETNQKIYLTSRLTEGSFPDYAQIIPKEFVTHGTLLRADFTHALKKTSIFTNKFLQVGVSVNPDNNTLILSSDNGELGTTKEDISCSLEGEELSLSFNQRYLTAPLQHFTDDSITLRFAGVGRPMVIEGVNDTSLRYLVMPMNR